MIKWTLQRINTWISLLCHAQARKFEHSEPWRLGVSPMEEDVHFKPLKVRAVLAWGIEFYFLEHWSEYEKLTIGKEWRSREAEELVNEKSQVITITTIFNSIDFNTPNNRLWKFFPAHASCKVHPRKYSSSGARILPGVEFIGPNQN